MQPRGPLAGVVPVGVDERLMVCLKACPRALGPAHCLALVVPVHHKRGDVRVQFQPAFVIEGLLDNCLYKLGRKVFKVDKIILQRDTSSQRGSSSVACFAAFS